MSAIWDLVRFLFCLPSSAPKYPKERSQKNSPVVTLLCLFFHPKALAEDTGGSRPWCQADSTVLRLRERQAGEFFIGVWGWLWKKHDPALAARRPGRQRERSVGLPVQLTTYCSAVSLPICARTHTYQMKWVHYYCPQSGPQHLLVYNFLLEIIQFIYFFSLAVFFVSWCGKAHNWDVSKFLKV